MLTDSHVHLNRSEFKGQWREVVERAVDAGVCRFLNVGYDLESSRASVELAAADERIFATVGIHPHDAALMADEHGELTTAGADALDELARLATEARVVAIGEIGLDYFRDLSPRPAQVTAVKLQLRLADRLGLPVVFHVRDAWPDLMALVDAAGPPRRGGVLHSFSGDGTARDWAVERGLLLGIGGPVTYPKSRLPEVLSGCDARDLLLETDAPWLPPQAWRGKRNESAYLPATAVRVAEILGVGEAELAAATEAVFDALFLPTAGGGAA